jgi:WD40 repeat protein
MDEPMNGEQEIDEASQSKHHGGSENESASSTKELNSVPITDLSPKLTISNKEEEEITLDGVQRLLTYQARQIVELERIIIQQRQQIHFLNWRTAGYNVRSFKGDVMHEGQVFALKLDDEGKHLASASYDKTILIWSMHTGKCVRRLRGHAAAIYCLDSEGDVLVSGSADKTILTWKFSTGESLISIVGHKGTVYCLKLIGNILISGSTDRSIKVWDVKTGELINSLEGHTGSVSQLAFYKKVLETTNVLASASLDQTIRLWNVYTGECLMVLRGHTDDVTCIRIAMDGLLLSASADKTIKVWDVERGECVRTISGHSASVNHLRVEDGGLCFLSASSDKTIKAWNVRTGELVRELKGHQQPVRCLEMAGNRIVSCSDEGVIKQWEMLFC